MSDESETIYGRFDVHSHLLPGLDDGCTTVAQSLDCARRLVAAGYTHTFCTPHYWPNLSNTPEKTQRAIQSLQLELNTAGIPFTLLPGGEVGLHESLRDEPLDALPTFGRHGKFLLCDIWADRLPSWFEPTIRYIQSGGITVILAHPERMRAVQDDLKLADYFKSLGMLLQGNLQCLADPPRTATRRVADEYLLAGRYSLLGSDLHNPQSLQVRLDGLTAAIERVGEETVARLTMRNPRKLADAAGEPLSRT